MYLSHERRAFQTRAAGVPSYLSLHQITFLVSAVVLLPINSTAVTDGKFTATLIDSATQHPQSQDPPNNSLVE